ncbi:MAG: putative teichuronic acid biosynthesis glycosyltransferase TuaH [Firmicutes bacterium]|nr:putative teichuronic acid biosynthesis glycosyltransferase TuaH [Bacillota bacterium]
MQLVYLSPVPWSSFAQRPHKFVAWFHANTGGDVLWVDPYPTRFPLFSDFRRIGSQENKENQTSPAWIRVIRPSALPIEPLPGSGWVNALTWRSTLKDIDAFFRQKPTLLAIGKPSALALAVLKRLKGCKSVYDAMDDFPAFYSGLSRFAMRYREQVLVRCVTSVLASSTALKLRWGDVRADIQLVHNGLDAEVLPAPIRNIALREKKVLGYVGTIAAWFDWNWVIALAKARPMDVVRLIGPVFAPAPCVLPKNMEMLPPCSHQAALLAMQDFDVGLIPFKKNDLTASVDPIKYYEYRALGLPVISTDFGEMAFRGDEEGTFLSREPQDINSLVQKALFYSADVEAIRQFIASNTWEARFAAAKIIQ